MVHLICFWKLSLTGSDARDSAADASDENRNTSNHSCVPVDCMHGFTVSCEQSVDHGDA